MKIWKERINTIFDDDENYQRVIASTYCTILESGKDDGEYSDRDSDLLKDLADCLGADIIRVLDAAVLENVRIAI